MRTPRTHAEVGLSPNAVVGHSLQSPEARARGSAPASWGGGQSTRAGGGLSVLSVLFCSVLLTGLCEHHARRHEAQARRQHRRVARLGVLGQQRRRRAQVADHARAHLEGRANRDQGPGAVRSLRRPHAPPRALPHDGNTATAGAASCGGPQRARRRPARARPAAAAACSDAGADSAVWCHTKGGGLLQQVLANWEESTGARAEG